MRCQDQPIFFHWRAAHNTIKVSRLVPLITQKDGNAFPSSPSSETMRRWRPCLVPGEQRTSQHLLELDLGGKGVPHFLFTPSAVKKYAADGRKVYKQLFLCLFWRQPLFNKYISCGFLHAPHKTSVHISGFCLLKSHLQTQLPEDCTVQGRDSLGEASSEDKAKDGDLGPGNALLFIWL